jgi:hypothetical protein
MAAGSMYAGEEFETGVFQVYICQGLSAHKIALHSPVIILCFRFVSILEVVFPTIFECWSNSTFPCQKQTTNQNLSHE